MAFKLVVSDTVAVPVRGVIPGPDGVAQPFNFTLVCRRMKADSLRLALANTEETVTEFMAGVVVGWSGVLDDADHALPFGDEALQSLLNVAGMAAVAFKAYLESVGARGKEKN